MLLANDHFPPVRRAVTQPVRHALTSKVIVNERKSFMHDAHLLMVHSHYSHCTNGQLGKKMYRNDSQQIHRNQHDMIN